MLARGKRKRVGRKDVAFLRGIVPPGAAKPWAKQSLTPCYSVNLTFQRFHIALLLITISRTPQFQKLSDRLAIRFLQQKSCARAFSLDGAVRARVATMCRLESDQEKRKRRRGDVLCSGVIRSLVTQSPHVGPRELVSIKCGSTLRN